MTAQTFFLPVKVIFGSGSVNQLGREARAIGRRAMIATHPALRIAGVLERVVKDLNQQGLEIQVFEDLEPNPRVSTIDAAAQIARQLKVDVVIGLGGGSAMDAAKGIALASSGLAPIWDHMLNTAPECGQVPALIQVPTLAGTGSELNQIAVLTEWESREKRCLFHDSLWARLAIVDPELTVTAPREVTAAGGVDIFSHIVEWYLMPEEPLPLNDAIREAVMRITVESLPRVLSHPDDIGARTQLSWASTIASSELSRLGGTVGSMTCHGLEHGVSGYYDISHGAGLAALLPAWMRQIYPARSERLASLGTKVFGRANGIAAFEEWLERVEMKLRLKDLGCELDRAAEVADLAMRVWDFQPHPTKVDTEVLAGIYREAY